MFALRVRVLGRMCFDRRARGECDAFIGMKEAEAGQRIVGGALLFVNDL